MPPVCVMEPRVSPPALGVLDGLGAVLDAPHEPVSAMLSALLEPLVPDRAIALLADAAARRSAIDLAAAALVELRASASNERAAGEEPADAAFARLRDELRPSVRYSQAELSFASPDCSRLLPAQIAQAGELWHAAASSRCSNRMA
jgi:hypothetical protein